jgi:hypothetical protein
MAIRNTGLNPPADARSLQFPIAESAAEFQKQSRRIASLSANAQTFIERAQPYNRRHHLMPAVLSLFNEFDNSDKHRILNLALSHVIDGKINFTSLLLGTAPDIYWLRTAVKDGTEVAFFTINPPQPDVQYDFEVSLCITVTHIPGPTGLHVTALLVVLNSLVREIKRIINDGAVCV